MGVFKLNSHSQKLGLSVKMLSGSEQNFQQSLIPNNASAPALAPAPTPAHAPMLPTQYFTTQPILAPNNSYMYFHDIPTFSEQPIPTFNVQSVPTFNEQPIPTFNAQPIPTFNEQSIPVSPSEFPSPKKPRNFESTSFEPNKISASRMAPSEASKPRGTGKIFFKTRICGKFKAGTCPYGKNCSFAHGAEELRKPPANWQDLVASHGDDRLGLWEDDQRIINRLKLCKKFCSGEECQYGLRCNFQHRQPSEVREELFAKLREDPERFREEMERFGEEPERFRDDRARFRESSAITLGAARPPVDFGDGYDKLDDNVIAITNVDQKPIFWKTKICNKWETTGQCPFGDKCHFAHGLAELQKFTVQDEVESTTSSPPAPNYVDDMAPASNTTIRLSDKQRKKNHLMKLGVRGINAIYGDWPDELLPPLRRSPIKDET